MARMAVIKDGVVVNVVEAGPGFSLPGHILIESSVAGPGDSFDSNTGVFSRPVVVRPVPDEVTDLQARLALGAAGLLDELEAIVAGASVEIKIWFDRALVWRRDSPMIAALAPQLGLSDAAIDDLFRAAASF